MLEVLGLLLVRQIRSNRQGPLSSPTAIEPSNILDQVGRFIGQAIGSLLVLHTEHEVPHSTNRQLLVSSAIVLVLQIVHTITGFEQRTLCRRTNPLDHCDLVARDYLLHC